MKYSRAGYRDIVHCLAVVQYFLLVKCGFFENKYETLTVVEIVVSHDATDYSQGSFNQCHALVVHVLVF